MTRYLTALRALGRLVWALITRRPVFVTPEQAIERLNICETQCQHFDLVHRKCQVCQCFVDAKTLLATESCPQRRWRRLPGLLFS